VVNGVTSHVVKNKKFWEELIIYFPSTTILMFIQIERTIWYAMKSIKQYNLRGCSVGTTEERAL
jgi:hypothetical protein